MPNIDAVPASFTTTSLTVTVPNPVIEALANMSKPPIAISVAKPFIEATPLFVTLPSEAYGACENVDNCKLPQTCSHITALPMAYFN